VQLPFHGTVLAWRASNGGQCTAILTRGGLDISFPFCSNARLVQWASAMAYTFDSLGYAKRLRDRGVPQEQAEAHAEAARDFIMAELVTKSDLKADLLATKQDLQTEFRSGFAGLQTELRSSVAELRNRIETQALRLTVTLGVMLAVAIGALATILKLS
jgi:hypothetical protein